MLLAGDSKRRHKRLPAPGPSHVPRTWILSRLVNACTSFTCAGEVKSCTSRACAMKGYINATRKLELDDDCGVLKWMLRGNRELRVHFEASGRRGLNLREECDQFSLADVGRWAATSEYGGCTEGSGSPRPELPPCVHAYARVTRSSVRVLWRTRFVRCAKTFMRTASDHMHPGAVKRSGSAFSCAESGDGLAARFRALPRI